MTALAQARAAGRAPRLVPDRDLDTWRPALAGAERTTSGRITLPDYASKTYAYDPQRGTLWIGGVEQERRRRR